MPLHFAVNCTAFTFPVRTASKIESDFKWFDLDGLKLIAWPAASNHASSFMPSSSPRESREQAERDMRRNGTHLCLLTYYTTGFLGAHALKAFTCPL
jgi:hypothetical protein